MALSQDTVLGVFENRSAADTALATLQEHGFNAKDISIITREEEGVVDANGDRADNVAEGALGGATTGGVIGALAGLLVGIGAIAVPGIGGLLVGGPLAAALGLTGAAATTASGAITGALAGGLVGGLVGLGLPEEEARSYEERVKEGAVLVAVPSTVGDDSTDAQQLLRDSGASQVRLLQV